MLSDSIFAADKVGARGYTGARPDVVEMIRTSPGMVLDVGCGAGLTAGLVTERYPKAVVVGVEPDEKLAIIARRGMSTVLQAKVDSADTLECLEQFGPFDLIICADVLEHLAEPARVLAALTQLLAKDGALITSVPNIRHISTFVSLGVFGTWPMRDRGIHDRTHLRFFARRNILELGRCAGLVLIEERRNLRLFEASAWSMIPAKLLDFWPFRGFLTFQYLHRWSVAEHCDAGH